MTDVYIMEFLGEMIPVTQNIKDPAGSKHPVGQNIYVNKPDFTGYGIASKNQWLFFFELHNPLI
jgi:hypothetical protein